MHYILDVLKKYAVFSGRASRPEFWYAYLAYVVLVFVVGFIPYVGYISPVIGLVFMIPWLAVGSRRLHDIGKSGWNQLWALTGVGVIVLIIWWAREGDPGENQYGPSPLIED